MFTALLIGFVGVLLLLSVWIFWDYNRRQDRALELGAGYGMEQVLRAREKFHLVIQIGRPECPDGSYSPNQMALWRRYQDLDEFDKSMTAWERNQIVETRGYS